MILWLRDYSPVPGTDRMGQQVRDGAGVTLTVQQGGVVARYEENSWFYPWSNIRTVIDYVYVEKAVKK